MESLDKFLFVFKPCQSGKTLLMIENIKNLDNVFGQDDINKLFIVFCDNSLLQTDQLKTRVEKENLDAFIISSKSEISNHRECYHQIDIENKKIIICCANNTQINNMNLLINDLNKKDYHIYIYIDEVDKTFSGKSFINLIKWNENNIVKKITMITASPEPILNIFNKKFHNKSIPILPIELSYDRDKYHKIDDSNLIYISDEFFCLEYILKEHTFPNNTILFCPGQIKRTTHYNIQEILCKDGFNVLVINSDGCNIYYYDNSKRELDKNDKFIDNKTVEVSKWLAKIYHNEQYNLKNKKFAITGNLSIGRGITISSPQLMITDAIIPTNSIESNLSFGYQLIGRLCGNMKEWDNYKKPNLYGSKKVISDLINYQNKVIDLVEKAYKYDKTSINPNIFNLNQADEKYGIPIKLEFSSILFDKFINFIIEIKGERRNIDKIEDKEKIKNKIIKYINKNQINIYNSNPSHITINKLKFKNFQIVGLDDRTLDKIYKYPFVDIDTYFKSEYRYKAEINCKEPGDAIIYILCRDYPKFENHGIYKGSIYITFLKN